MGAVPGDSRTPTSAAAYEFCVARNACDLKQHADQLVGEANLHRLVGASELRHRREYRLGGVGVDASYARHVDDDVRLRLGALRKLREFVFVAAAQFSRQRDRT